jgi:putative oxidoreductase
MIMRYTPLFERYRDGLLLLARVFLVALFVIFGWDKFLNFSGTVSYMESTGLPFAALAAGSALVMELVVGVAICWVSTHGHWRCCLPCIPWSPP